MRFLHLEAVGSTQDEARALYEAGERGPLWVRADRQTKGRGRLDRNWSSPEGNLYATLILPNALDPSQSALVGFVAAVALAETLESYDVERAITLKWPNDVLVGGAKISGILIEREKDVLLVGMGLNLVWHPDDTPYPATHLLAEMTKDSLDDAEPPFCGAGPVLAKLSSRFMHWLQILETEGFQPVREAWLSRAHALGGTVKVNGLDGRFDDLSLDGSLCLRLPDGKQTRVHTGDVSFG